MNLPKKESKKSPEENFSYFKESTEEEKEEADKTKLFFDENILKKSFLKKRSIT